MHDIIAHKLQSSFHSRLIIQSYNPMIRIDNSLWSVLLQRREKEGRRGTERSILVSVNYYNVITQWELPGAMSVVTVNINESNTLYKNLSSVDRNIFDICIFLNREIDFEINDKKIFKQSCDEWQKRLDRPIINQWKINNTATLVAPRKGEMRDFEVICTAVYSSYIRTWWYDALCHFDAVLWRQTICHLLN